MEPGMTFTIEPMITLGTYKHDMWDDGWTVLTKDRKWTAQFEWYAHHQFAMKAGLDPAIAAAIAEGKRPNHMQDDEAAIYAFCTELLETAQVSDATFRAATERFGEQGVIDVIGALGYYSMVSMVLNVDRYPLPQGVEPPLRPLPRRGGG